MPRMMTGPRERLAAYTAPPDERGCTEWTRYANPGGYGVLSIGPRRLLVHRFAWEVENGPIPPGMTVDHRCRNRLCVNVSHLRLLTRRENSRHRGLNKNNTSGYRGVAFSHSNGRWHAFVSIDGRRHSAGSFTTAEEAANAARLKRIELFGAHLEPEIESIRGDI